MSKEAIKNDEDKLRWDLLPWDALEEVVEVITKGARKYDDRNWEKGLNYSRLHAASIRHLTAWYQSREDFDSEWNLSHLAHATCCLLFLLAYHKRGFNNSEKDDRPRPITRNNPQLFSGPQHLIRSDMFNELPKLGTDASNSFVNEKPK